MNFFEKIVINFFRPKELRERCYIFLEIVNILMVMKANFTSIKHENTGTSDKNEVKDDVRFDLCYFGPSIRLLTVWESNKGIRLR